MLEKLPDLKVDGELVKDEDGKVKKDLNIEYPLIPERPLPYQGPVIGTDGLQILSGYGKPTTGWVKFSLGGKSFGV
jgi:hypothetical protein